MAMNTGKIAIGAIVLSAIIAGFGLYYLQVYAFYDALPPETDEILLTSLSSGEPEAVAVDGFSGIDSDSSPIRYRACFEMPASLAMLTETYVIAEEAEPLIAPGWFDCFDAERIGADLAEGVAIPFMGVKNIVYGVDRVVAVYPDGRGYAWNMLNFCGEVVFDGDPVPAECPEPPEGVTR